MILNQKVASRTGIPEHIVKKVIELFEDGGTIPFIARYRKEQTNSLDEVSIANIQIEFKKVQELIKRRESILSSIEEQGQLTDQLRKNINSCWDEKKLEDFYLPYKRKTKTKASIARENGLEGLANLILSQKTSNIIANARKYVNKKVPTAEDAIQGAKFIIAEWVSENISVRDIVRNIFDKQAVLYAKLLKDKESEGEKFRDYFEFKGELSRTPSHRLLAILRGETEGILKVKVDIDSELVSEKIARFFIKYNNEAVPFIEQAIDDALKRLILPSIRNEILKEYKDKADEEAIRVFARNAQELLLSPPLGAKRILGIDPGFKSGCKTVCIDEFGDLIHHENIYPHPPQNQGNQAQKVIADLLSKFEIEVIAIGNGTAGKETYKWLKSFLKDKQIELFLINEDGASIYSASEIGRNEFPDYDITVRGAVSIARRLMDPLAELVKIDPKSIGVGQYQHDVNQKKLKDSLALTVESCVNKVGVNINTGSQHLLSYVSGLGPVLAENIVNYRKEKGKFEKIDTLMKVPRIGAKAFEQCAGFLRIKNGKNPLDDTGVHPESYPIVNKILKDLKLDITQLVAKDELLNKINLADYVDDKIGMPTLKDIISELKKPGLDPRSTAQAIHFDEGIESISDLFVGQILTGVVTNLTKFGAFLDIGIKESALLHISQIVNKFISDPAQELSINQEIKVKIIDIDIDRKRISVSKKDVNQHM